MDEEKKMTWYEATLYVLRSIVSNMYSVGVVMIGASYMALMMAVPLFLTWHVFHTSLGLPELTYWQIWAMLVFVDLFIVDVKPS